MMLKRFIELYPSLVKYNDVIWDDYSVIVPDNNQKEILINIAKNCLYIGKRIKLNF